MTDKTEIAQWLQTTLHEHLFGPKSWPIENDHAVHEQLLRWELIEHGEFGFYTSALGSELGVEEWTDFVGHHVLSEIPHRLADCGLLTQDEADDIIFRRWEEDDERLEDILPPVSSGIREGVITMKLRTSNEKRCSPRVGGALTIRRPRCR